MESKTGNRTENSLTLSRWLILHTGNTETYRAGRMSGEKHPPVDQKLLNQVGGMRSLIQQAKEMEQDKELSRYIRFEWRDMGLDIEKLHYSVEIIPLLCEREGMEEPAEKQKQYIETVEEFLREIAGTGISQAEWLKDYYGLLLKRLKQGKLIKEMKDKALFYCLNAIAQIRKPVWKRVFSAQVFRDSKKFEKEYEAKVLGILRAHSNLAEIDAMTEEEVLKSHGILSYAQVLEWKGPLVYRLDTGSVIDTSGLSYGAIVNSQTLEHAKPTALPGVRSIMIIENKANYENMTYREDTLYIFCHGFFSPKEVKFLQKLAELTEDKAESEIEFLHWGDMDYGGIRIFRFNQEKIFPKLKLCKMDRKSFLAAINVGAGIPIETKKKEKLERMDAGELDELKQCILEYGMEIEQEIFLAYEQGEEIQMSNKIPKSPAKKCQ